MSDGGGEGARLGPGAQVGYLPLVGELVSDRLLAVSMGCPAGVGAEVTLAAGNPPHARVVVFGDHATLDARCTAVGFDRERLVTVSTPEEARALEAGLLAVVQVGPPLAAADRSAGAPTREGGRAQLAFLEAACEAVVRGGADALVTAPVAKETIASSGAPGSEGFLGHTEWLGTRLDTREAVMAFVADALVITLATTHLPLARVATSLTPSNVERAAYWTVRLVDRLGFDPRLAVAVLALNPHAGEHGLLGVDEETTIAPGIGQARERLASEGRARILVGPLPAESAIRRAARDRAYAACVAMYHDQATIPSKLLAFGDAVNVTLGLPIVRTSVDHGTAYDIAGTGRADPRGMRAALEMAVRLLCGD